MEDRVSHIETQLALHDQRLTQAMQKLEHLPTRDETKLMFIEEGRKLAEGLIKKDDDQQKQISYQKDDITTLKTNQKWIVLVGGIFGTAIVKFWDMLVK